MSYILNLHLHFVTLSFFFQFMFNRASDISKLQTHCGMHASTFLHTQMTTRGYKWIYRVLPAVLKWLSIVRGL